MSKKPKHRNLKVGDVMRGEDEVLYRGQWLRIQEEFSHLAGFRYAHGMTKVRRKVEDT